MKTEKKFVRKMNYYHCICVMKRKYLNYIWGEKKNTITNNFDQIKVNENKQTL